MTTNPALLEKLRRMEQIASQVETGSGRLFQLDHAATLREAIAVLERPLAGGVEGDPSERPELPQEFYDWRKENCDFINRPVMQSLLYDINLLPEQIMHFRDRKTMSYLVGVIEHFKQGLSLEYARGVEDAAKLEDAEVHRLTAIATDLRHSDRPRSMAREMACLAQKRAGMIRALLPKVPATEDAHYEPSDEEAYGAMIFRGKQEARASGADDD